MSSATGTSAVDDGLTDILSEHILDLLLCISPLHHQSLRTVHGPLRAQLRIQELNDVFGLAVHPSADIGDVGEDGLLRAFSGDLRRDDGVSPFLASEFGVMCTE